MLSANGRNTKVLLSTDGLEAEVGALQGTQEAYMCANRIKEPRWAYTGSYQCVPLDSANRPGGFQQGP